MSDDNVIKMDDLRSQQVAGLQELLAQKRSEERKAQFKQALGQLPKTHVLRQTRRNIARVATELSRRQNEQLETKGSVQP